jgi:hypothetical protein
VNFLEAAEIAKENPGSVVSRSESGLFFVRLKDGETVTSPKKTASPQEGEHESVAVQIARLESLVATQCRQIDVAHAEIRQLRLEVNNLKAAVGKIPSSEWSRFEEEQRKLDELRRAAEAQRLVGLARSGVLSYEQLILVTDNASSLGIRDDDLAFLHEAVRHKRSAHTPIPTIVYSTTDGQ